MNTSPERPGTTEDTSPTPLTLTTTLGEGSILGPTPTVPTDIDAFSLQNEWIYLTRFNWSESDQTDKLLFQWNTRRPLAATTTAEAVPWQIYTQGIASWLSTDYELGFLFVKLPNVRASFELEMTYNHPLGPLNTVDSTTTAENIIMEVGDQSFVTVPLYPYWNGMNAWNDVSSTNDSVRSMVPSTNVKFRVRLPYVPTNLQPKKFEVLVFMRPINTRIEGTILRVYNNAIPCNQLI